MRPALLSAALLPFAVTAYALSPIPKDRSPRAVHPPQHPLAPGPAMPPTSDPPSPAGGPGSAVLLSDVMGRDRSINIFAGLVRDVEAASRRLDDAAQHSTVLAPRNSAVEALPRRPWEDPDDYGRLGADAYEGDEGRERAARNVRRLVEAHVVPVHPWREGERVATMGGEGGEVWWEERQGGGKVVSLVHMWFS